MSLEHVPLRTQNATPLPASVRPRGSRKVPPGWGCLPPTHTRACSLRAQPSARQPHAVLHPTRKVSREQVPWELAIGGLVSGLLVLLVRLEGPLAYWRALGRSRVPGGVRAGSRGEATCAPRVSRWWRSAPTCAGPRAAKAGAHRGGDRPEIASLPPQFPSSGHEAGSDQGLRAWRPQHGLPPKTTSPRPQLPHRPCQTALRPMVGLGQPRVSTGRAATHAQVTSMRARLQAHWPPMSHTLVPRQQHRVPHG